MPDLPENERESRVEAAPPNLAEKLREDAKRYETNSLNPDHHAFNRGVAAAKLDDADDLDHAIPPEVWGRKIARAQALRESVDEIAYHQMSQHEIDEWRQKVADEDCEIAVLCPPHIQKKYGWEPRTTDKETRQ